MYEIGLRDAVQTIHDRGHLAHVLDIGTGTGLLSMMAVRCGADTVTACEAFQPMANCASQVIADNGFADKIKLIHKRSTEITVGADGDMSERANILVTEVFDTELIGEGGIGTFHHAHKCLLKKDCIVVPSAANMYIQVVDSELVQRWNKFLPIRIKDGDDIIPPEEINQCPGGAGLHDLQLDQLSPDLFKPITEPTHVFRFDYSGRSPIKFSGTSQQVAAAVQGGTCRGLFMWWDLEMDMKSKVILSCAPRWAHPTPDNMQWRDHWMQAVYYPMSNVTVTTGERLVIHSFHDEYSLWFDVGKPEINGPERASSLEAPMCRCGAHICCSRTRIGMLNDACHNQKYLDVLRQVITPQTVCLCVSDGSLLPLMAARLGASMVYTIETQPMMARMIEKYIACNKLKSRVKVLDKSPHNITEKDLDGRKVDILLAEPYFSVSSLPWHDVYFWYARTELANRLSDVPSVLPCCASLRAVAVEFDNLWRIRAPVRNCEGFDLSVFDHLIMNASNIADDIVEPHPLWEYPCVPLTDTFNLLNLDLRKPLQGVKTVERNGYTSLWDSGTLNGVAIWMEFNLDKKTTISKGLLSPPSAGKQLKWYMHARQGVFLFQQPHKVNLDDKCKLKYRLVFKPKTGEFEVDFLSD
ncbi:Protein arginine N-methyltransferase 7 [Lamellibrachia satsuma]|nr:Protein arginine N-methyltransferase 7 [Lamellibrachia satsuma]